MEDTKEIKWLRYIIECDDLLLETLTNEQVEDLVDDWCDQALVEGDSLDRNELLRQLREWLDNREFSL